jgi:hypothetical protein
MNGVRYELAGVSFLVVHLCKVDGCVLEEREIEPVKPDDGTRAFIPVVVPVP